LAYPGTTPVLDMSEGHPKALDGGFYLDGFEVVNIISNEAVVFNDQNNTFRRNYFHGGVKRPGSTNTSVLFSLNGGYLSIQDNIFADLVDMYGVLGYKDHKVLIENNTVHDLKGPNGHSHALSPKGAPESMWCIRGNYLFNVGQNGIHLQYENAHGTRDFEISHNLVFSSGRAFDFNMHTNSGPLFVHHNTFVGRVAMGGVDSQDGPVYIYNNIFINEIPGIKNEGSDVPVPASHQLHGVSWFKTTDWSRLLLKDNLTGTAQAGIVDKDGRLTAAYAKYLGTRGHQDKDGKSPPWPAKRK